MNIEIRALVKRVEKLEAAVFSKKVKPLKSGKDETTSGPKGGILILISKGFFSPERALDDVVQALRKAQYRYHKDVVRNALNRLSSKKGPLTKFREAGVTLFAERK
jgi:enolase